MAGTRGLGILLVLASSVPFAMSGVLTRYVSADVWTMLAWRGLFGSILTWSYFEMTRPAGPRLRLGWRGWLLASIGTAASITFLAAFRMTYVANVALIYAMTPFAAGALGWWLLRERVRAAVLWAALASVLGVGIIVWGGLGAPRFMGDSVAVAMALLSGLYLVMVRMFTATPVVMAGVASSFQLIVLAFLVSDPLVISMPDLFWSAVFGMSYAVGFILWSEGARRIPAAEAGLLGVAETPAAVLFAWGFLAEVPPLVTLIGGAVVVAAVLSRAWLDRRG